MSNNNQKWKLSFSRKWESHGKIYSEITFFKAMTFRNLLYSECRERSIKSDYLFIFLFFSMFEQF